MKDWLERFKQWLLAEDYAKKKKEKHVEYETYEEEYEEVEPQVAPIPVANKHLTIRTANIYPKRAVEQAVERRKSSSNIPNRKSKPRKNNEAFPFPLIPDELPAKERRGTQETRQKHRPEPHEHTSTGKRQLPASPATESHTVGQKNVGPGAHATTNPSRKEKRPFRPTEIISPIYGRKRPEQHREEEKNEQPLTTLVHPMVLKQTVGTPKVEGERPNTEDHTAMPVHTPSAESDAPVEEEKAYQPLSSSQQDFAREQFLSNSQADVESAICMQPDTPVQPDTPDNAEKEVSAPACAKREEMFSVFPDSISGQQETTVTESEQQITPIHREEDTASPAHPIQPEKRIVSPVTGVDSRREEHEWMGPSTAMPAPAMPTCETYEKPPLSLLTPPPRSEMEDTEYVEQQRDVLATTLHNFNVNAEVIGAVRGPTVTRYEIQPAPGVKVNKITNLIDDIKLSLAARDIRIEAPIPGRSAVGIEVPNERSMPVFLRSILESPSFRKAESPLTVALGMDIGGEPILADLAKMPHGLIAGATGSGKSVCINSIILSLLYKASPEEVRLLLVDPKMVELAPYNRLPHLVAPVVTDPKQATAALKWAVQEMDGRYEKFAEAGARDITRYNDLMRRAYPGEKEYLMPSIVIIIDELADLMMVAPHDVEEAICRIAQKARACGIHLLVATQRPSVDVITGLIKANIPTRVAFSVSSQTDSRTILDMNGAERLLGRGDMLYLSSGSPKPVRLQGPYVSDDEIESVTAYVRDQAEPNYLFEKEELTQAIMSENTDELFAEVVLFCVENGQASASLLQRNFQIGYNRAARLIDMMEEKGFISGQTGNSKPRDVFLTLAEYDNLFRGDTRRE